MAPEHTGILDREKVERTIRQLVEVDVRYAPDQIRELHNRLLAHDAALRARIEALEAERERLRAVLRDAEERTRGEQCGSCSATGRQIRDLMRSDGGRVP